MDNFQFIFYFFLLTQCLLNSKNTTNGITLFVLTTFCSTQPTNSKTKISQKYKNVRPECDSKNSCNNHSQKEIFSWSFKFKISKNFTDSMKNRSTSEYNETYSNIANPFKNSCCEVLSCGSFQIDENFDFSKGSVLISSFLKTSSSNANNTKAWDSSLKNTLPNLYINNSFSISQAKRKTIFKPVETKFQTKLIVALSVSCMLLFVFTILGITICISKWYKKKNNKKLKRNLWNSYDKNQSSLPKSQIWFKSQGTLSIPNRRIDSLDRQNLDQGKENFAFDTENSLIEIKKSDIQNFYNQLFQFHHSKERSTKNGCSTNSGKLSGTINSNNEKKDDFLVLPDKNSKFASSLSSSSLSHLNDSPSENKPEECINLRQIMAHDQFFQKLRNSQINDGLVNRMRISVSKKFLGKANGSKMYREDQKF